MDDVDLLRGDGTMAARWGARRDDETREPETKWPPLLSVVLAVGLAFALWALIFAVLGWLFF